MTTGDQPAQLTVRHVATGDPAPGPDATIEGWRTPPECLITTDDVGSARLAIPRDHPKVPALDVTTRLQYRYGDVEVFLSRWLEAIDDTLLGPGDDRARDISYQVRGIMAELDDVVVQPESGVGKLPFFKTRYCDWRSTYIDRSSWTPTVFPAYDDPAGQGVVGLYGRHWPPNGWPAPFAGWSYREYESGSSQHPVGTCYGALLVDLPAVDRFIADLWMASDDAAEFSWNTTPWLIGDEAPQSSWELPYRRVGWASGNQTVLVTWRHTNNDWKWPSNALNVAAIAFGCWRLDSVTSAPEISYDNLIFQSGRMPNALDPDSPLPDGAYWSPLLDQPPGFTPGLLWHVLLSEAQLAGFLPDWTWTFSPTLTSLGTPWAVETPYELAVGETYLQVLQRTVQDDATAYPNPGMPPTFNLVNKGELIGATPVAVLRGRRHAATDDDVNLKRLRYRLGTAA